MPDYIGLAQKVLQNRANSGNLPPWGPAAINAVMNRDSRAGTEIANNILSSFGIPETSKEEIISIATAKLKEQNLL